jgi:hypothetical protein
MRTSAKQTHSTIELSGKPGIRKDAAFGDALFVLLPEEAATK